MSTITTNQAANVKEIDSSFFGKSISFEYNPVVISYAIVLLRIVIGWTFFQAGITKVLTPDWTAAGFLNFAVPEGNPFIGLWAGFAGNGLIDLLVPWGLTLTGIGLVLGALVRWNAFWAAFMMVMFWMASLTGGLAEFLPLEHGWVIDDHLVYAALVFGLGAIGAGRVFGVDAYLEKTELVQNNRLLKLLLG